MEGGYQRKSKYSNKTAGELAEIKRERYREWKNRLSKEQREELEEKQKKGGDRIGRCEICGEDKEYADLYQHKKSKKHKEMVENGGIVKKNKIKECSRAKCEICGKEYKYLQKHIDGQKHQREVVKNGGIVEDVGIKKCNKERCEICKNEYVNLKKHMEGEKHKRKVENGER